MFFAALGASDGWFEQLSTTKELIYKATKQ